MKKNIVSFSLILVSLFGLSFKSTYTAAASAVTEPVLQAVRGVCLGGLRCPHKIVILEEAAQYGRAVALKGKPGRPVPGMYYALKLSVVTAPKVTAVSGFDRDLTHVLATKMPAKRLQKAMDTVTPQAAGVAQQKYYMALTTNPQEEANRIVEEAAIRAGIKAIRRRGRPSNATLNDLNAEVEAVFALQKARTQAQFAQKNQNVRPKRGFLGSLNKFLFGDRQA